MTPGRLPMLQSQFRLIWQLATVHLPMLTDEACLWEPASDSWTVRRSTDGKWRPDWTEPEPDPAPPATIGWLSWHLDWWWSSMLGVMNSGEPRPRDEAFWPGTAAATVRRLETLSTDWAAALADLDDAGLSRSVAYPWPEPRALGDALGWSNIELMKNIAEIGYVRHLFEASKRQRGG